MNEYMTIKEASQKWNISIRRINTLCNEERIPGCVKFGMAWAIPVDAEKPSGHFPRISRGMETHS